MATLEERMKKLQAQMDRRNKEAELRKQINDAKSGLKKLKEKKGK